MAALARLNLSETEVASLQKDISSILEYVGQVSAAEGNTFTKAEELSPANHNVMRDDIPRAKADPLWGKEEVLQAAFPVSEGGYNIVRKIIQKDE